MKADLDTLKKYIDLGIGLAAVNDYGAYAENDKSKRFVKKIDAIEKMIEGKYSFSLTTLPKGVPIKVFRFIPKEAGLFCFDFDIKNGVNGIAFFKRMTKNKGIDFSNVFNKTAFVKTPNSGYHFYFNGKYKGMLKTEICKGVEIKHSHALTAGGSVKDGKLYELKGELKNALPLPRELLDLAKKEKRELSRISRVPKSKKIVNIDILLNEAINEKTGHNNRAFIFAVKCNRCNIPQGQTLEFIYSKPEIFGTDFDLKKTVASGYGV